MVGSKDMHLIKGSEDTFLTVSAKDMHTNYQDDSYRKFDENGKSSNWQYYSLFEYIR